nr:hypothetical protein [Prevotella sp.]
MLSTQETNGAFRGGLSWWRLFAFNECTLHIYPSGGHGWGFRNTAQGFRYHVQMLDDLTTWLQHF